MERSSRVPFSDKQTPRWLTHWGVLLCICCFSITANGADNCVLDGEAQTVTLEAVHDGDTIQLTDGRKIRVLGINTPEVAHNDQPLEPLAEEARQATLTFLSQTPSIKIRIGAQQQDQYKRWLAFVYTSDGENLSAYLLEKGLAAQVIIPPNVDDIVCLHNQEEKAKLSSLGIWKHPYFKARPANQLMLDDAGFRFITGVVDNISTSNEAWWFTLDDEVEVKINQLAWPYLNLDDIKKLKGKQITVRGWLVDRSKYHKSRGNDKKWVITIHHPFMIEQH